MIQYFLLFTLHCNSVSFLEIVGIQHNNLQNSSHVVILIKQTVQDKEHAQNVRFLMLMSLNPPTMLHIHRSKQESEHKPVIFAFGFVIIVTIFSIIIQKYYTERRIVHLI